MGLGVGEAEAVGGTRVATEVALGAAVAVGDAVEVGAACTTAGLSGEMLGGETSGAGVLQASQKPTAAGSAVR